MCASVCVFAQVYLEPFPPPGLWDCPHQGQTSQHKMNIRWVFQSPLSLLLLLLPLGVPSLESHSPSSPFTHHEEKIQNMRCASLILLLPDASATSEPHVRCHFSGLDTWQRRQRRSLEESSPVEILWVTCLSRDGGFYESSSLIDQEPQFQLLPPKRHIHSTLMMSLSFNAFVVGKKKNKNTA